MHTKSVSKPLIIAHRGARSKAPENTLESIKLAMQYSPAGIEFDVDITKDFKPIVIHQETLELDSSSEKLIPAGAEPARAWTLSKDLVDIELIDAGSWFSSKFSNLKIPKLDDVLALNWNKTFALLELKDPYFWGAPGPADWPQKVASIVTSQLQSFTARGMKLQVLSFNPQMLQEISKIIPSLQRVQAFSTRQDKQYSTSVKSAADSGSYAIAISELRILREPEWLKEAHHSGMKVYVYERTPAFEDSGYRFEADKKKDTWEKLIALGVDAIETDFVEELTLFLK